MMIAALAMTLHAAPATERATAPAAVATAHGQRHHYTIGARIRPLLFWIGKDDVGDAVLTKRRGPDLVGYALLIGSDPARAPRGINRWGYLSEEIRGGEATLVGLMTESDEQSIDQAEASLRKKAGDRTYNVIHASIAGGEARSVVTAVAAPASYTFRNVDNLLSLADRTGVERRSRVAHLPPGARPGFLAALADLIHLQTSDWRASGQIHPSEPIAYVYHGNVYRLRVQRAHAVKPAHGEDEQCQHVIASQLQIVSAKDGETDEFSITYAADGPLAEIPLTATYQPRWWIEIRLTLDDSKLGPALVSGTNP
jgi:hypothetical protein